MPRHPPRSGLDDSFEAALETLVCIAAKSLQLALASTSTLEDDTVCKKMAPFANLFEANKVLLHKSLFGLSFI
jgi:hypothetical protein